MHVHTDQRDCVQVIDLTCGWILNRDICLSDSLSYVLVADHPHSDSHQFGRDCFFRMTVLFSFCCKINNLKIAGVTASNIYFQVPRSVEVP